MEERFAGLLVAAIAELEKLGVPVGKVQLYLTSLKASTQADVPLFDQYTLSLLNESSLDQIFTILSRTGAVNFLNFRLLQLVVKHFGNENLQNQVDQYGEEVTKFMRETKFIDFYRIWSGQAVHGSLFGNVAYTASLVFVYFWCVFFVFFLVTTVVHCERKCIVGYMQPHANSMNSVSGS